MKFNEVDKCLRCNSEEFLIHFPLKVCKTCKCIIAADNMYNPTNVKYIKFQVSDDRIELNFLENKTYLNGKEFMNFSLPVDISEDKLKHYIQLAVFS